MGYPKLKRSGEFSFSSANLGHMAAKRGRPELQKMRIGGRGVKTATQMHERAQGHEGK